MYAAFLANIGEGFLQPRRSLRRLLDLEIGLRETALMVVLGYVIGAIFGVLIMPVEGPTGGGLDHVTGVINWVAVLLLVAWIAWLPPRIFGGKGSWGDALRAVAWLSVLTGVLQPLPMIAIAMLPTAEIVTALSGQDREAMQAAMEMVSDQTRATVVMIFVFTGTVILWLFSSFVAEIHRFRATWQVMGTIFGLYLVFSMLLSGVTG